MSVVQAQDAEGEANMKDTIERIATMMEVYPYAYKS